MMCKVNLQNLVLVFVVLLSETTYISAQLGGYDLQATYDSNLQLSPAADYQQQQQLQNPSYEIDVDTYIYDAGTSPQKANETASTKQTQQNDPPKQVGYRVEYDLIEPDPPTTPKPYPDAYYDAQSDQSQVQRYQAQVQAQASLPTYNSVPQSQQYSALTNVATPTFQIASGVDLIHVPQSQQYSALANVAKPTFQTASGVDLSHVPQSQQHAAYANVATPTFQTANRVDVKQATSYYDRLVQRSNYVNPSHPPQQAKSRTATQLNQAQVRYIRQQLQARLIATQNLRRAQLANLQRQRLAVQQRNSRQLYQSVPVPNQGTNQIQGTLGMKCTSLYEAWNLQHMKNLPSTCGARLRCPELYARTVQNGRFCMCCSNYATVVGAYRKAMQQRQSQNQHRPY